MILTKMKETAEAYLGHKVTHAVVTVPACKYCVSASSANCSDNSRLQRRSAVRDQGRRNHRRSYCPADCQRAYRCCDR